MCGQRQPGAGGRQGLQTGVRDWGGVGRESALPALESKEEDPVCHVTLQLTLEPGYLLCTNSLSKKEQTTTQSCPQQLLRREPALPACLPNGLFL